MEQPLFSDIPPLGHFDRQLKCLSKTTHCPHFELIWVHLSVRRPVPEGNGPAANGAELYKKSTIEIIKVTDTYYLYKIYAVRENTEGLGNLVGIGKLYRG